MRFGNYVIQEGGHRGALRSDGRVDLLYRVMCDCGRKSSWVRLSQLRNKKQNRCDLCGKERRFGLSINDDIPLRNNYINNAKRNAIRRGLFFDVSRKDLWELFEKQGGLCAYTKLELTLDKHWPRGRKQTASIDRIDSKVGYVEGNVQWIHKDVNLMKMDLSEERFLELCRLITKHK